jgi:hypothetical protein
MKFATSKEHRDFFQKNGWIEFEDFISNEQLALVNQAIDQVLAERLKTSSDRLHSFSAEQFYLHGHDLWRSHPVLQKLATQKRLAEIAAELIEKRTLRLGYDQLFPCASKLQANVQNVYMKFLGQTANLQAVSSIQEVSCGLLISLDQGEEEGGEEISSDEPDIFPRKPGHVIFFQPGLDIRWEKIFQHPEQRFYLLVYTQAVAHYQLQPGDPHTHSLKRLGYVFTDRLNDKLHPIVYR